MAKNWLAALDHVYTIPTTTKQDMTARYTDGIEAWRDDLVKLVASSPGQSDACACRKGCKGCVNLRRCFEELHQPPDNNNLRLTCKALRDEVDVTCKRLILRPSPDEGPPARPLPMVDTLVTYDLAGLDALVPAKLPGLRAVHCWCCNYPYDMDTLEATGMLAASMAALAPRLEAFTLVTEYLTWHDAAPSIVRHLGTFTRLRALKMRCFYEGDEDDADYDDLMQMELVQSLSCLTALEHLTLVDVLNSNNGWRVAAEAIGRMSRLRELTLTYHKDMDIYKYDDTYDEGELADAVADLPELRKLDLRTHFLTQQLWAALRTRTALEELALRWQNAPEVSWVEHILPALTQLTGLRRLQLSGSTDVEAPPSFARHEHDALVQAFGAALTALTALTALSLSRVMPDLSMLDAAHAVALWDALGRGLGRATQLEHLALVSCQMNRHGMECLAVHALRRLSGLRTLVLNNSLSTMGLRHGDVTALCKELSQGAMPRLRVLDLSFNDLHNNEVTDLCMALRRHTELEVLDLRTRYERLADDRDDYAPALSTVYFALKANTWPRLRAIGWETKDISPGQWKRTLGDVLHAYEEPDAREVSLACDCLELSGYEW